MFLVVYCVYGVSVMCYLLYAGVPFEMRYIGAWMILILGISFVTFSFYRGYIFHGVAFATIDELSFEYFKIQKENETSRTK
jgi:hypothetical protein